MKALARSHHVWWTQINKDIEKFVGAYEACLAVKASPPLAPLHSWVWPSRPFLRVHIDCAGPFLGKMFFLLVDAHSSKWPEVFIMTDTSMRTKDHRGVKKDMTVHGLLE